MYATPCSSASCATSLSTLKPMRLPANAGVSAHSIDDAAERGLEEPAHGGDDARIGARVRDQLAAADDRRRVEQVDAEEVRAEVVAAAGAHRGDREARGHGRDDRARRAHAGRRARTPAAWSRGPRRRTRRSGRHSAATRARSLSYVPIAIDFAGDLAFRQLLGPRAAGFGLLERPREHRGGDAGGGKHGRGARTHRAVGPEDDDLPDGTHEAPVSQQTAYRAEAIETRSAHEIARRAISLAERARSERDAEPDLRRRRCVARDGLAEVRVARRSARCVSLPLLSIVLAQIRSS